MSATPFVIERAFQAPLQQVWKAITDKDEMKQWYLDLAEFKPEVGFKFQFVGGSENKQYVHLCQVTEVEVGKKLTYTWRFEGLEGNSFVSFELFPDGENTRLKFSHTGIETFAKNGADFAKEDFVEGWTHIIGTSLRKYLEATPVS